MRCQICGDFREVRVCITAHKDYNYENSQPVRLCKICFLQQAVTRVSPVPQHLHIPVGYEWHHYSVSEYIHSYPPRRVVTNTELKCKQLQRRT